MKNKIKLTGFAVFFMIIAFALTSCLNPVGLEGAMEGGGGNGTDKPVGGGTPTHTHDFSGTWQKDTTGHWKVCSADSAIGQKAAHSPANGICSTCGYDNTPTHTHDFSGAWQKDATNHWKVCAADSAIGQKAAHTPTDGVCTVCSYLTYSIGDTGPAGGIIFYVSAVGFTMTGIAGTCHYLEASPANLTGGTGSDATMRWSTATDSPYPATSGTLTTIGSGKNNTAIIIAAESDVFPGNTYMYAARVCGAYIGGGKDDWFLPSKDELNELYKAKGTTGILTTDLFWSSSQDNASGAWFQYFNSGQQGYALKWADTVNVRAVRAF